MLEPWLTAVTSTKEESAAMKVPAAVGVIKTTPPEKRSEFAAEIR